MVTLLCGVIPAMRATRSELAGSLATGSRTQVSTRHPMQWTLVGIQVMLAVTLLSGAGLLLRSFQELARVSPGFDSTHVLTLHISGSWHETADMKALKQRIDTTIEALRALPGVEAAATSDTLPGVPNQFPADVKILEGESDPNRKFAADARFVSQGYFATMKIPVLAGEPCRQSPPNYEVVVNRAFVSMVFGDREAIGHHVQSALSSQSQLAGEIRGIVGDAREQGINSAPGPLVYWCISAPTPDPFFLIRTRTEPLAMTETVRHAIHEIEPSRAVFDISSLEDQLDNAFAENRMRTILLSFFAFTAVSLACIGLYGTLGYLVNLRRREVGLRLALGARRDQIATHFLVRGLRVCIVGCLLGLLLAAASGRLLDGMLFGVSANDPPTIISVVALILVVSLLASLLPALRASRTDPMNVLREG
jgi:predicted permease